MNVLNKLTIKNLKLNRKRTIVTIIGIMLSVALITAVATMYSSAIQSLINYEIHQQGNFHVAFYNVPVNNVSEIKNNRGIEQLYLTSDIGYAKLKNSKNKYKPYVFVKGFTKEALNNLSVKLLDGKFPENENEILIPTHLKTNGRVTLNIGDNISLNVGKRVLDGNELNQNNPYVEEQAEEIINAESKTYKIVGIIERPATNIEEYSAPGYTFITYINENNMKNNVNVYAKFTKEGSNNYLKTTAHILNVNEEKFTKLYTQDFDIKNQDEFDELVEEANKAKYEININSYLIALENNPFKEASVGSLGIVVAIVCIIIIVTSVFCIKNSFDISITEKIKQYGMLRSIGATKKQIKYNVFYEAGILGVIGITLGLLLGFFASYILIIVSNLLLKDMFSNGLKLVLSYSWGSFAISCILGIVTIYLSALRSANKAAKVAPVESIKNSAEIKIKSKKIKSPKIIKKLFGVGGEISYKNLKRNKKKYRTTVVSIIVSVSAFIGLSYFITSAFSYIDSEITRYDYNVTLSIIQQDEELEKNAVDTVDFENIENYAIYRSKQVNIKNPKYSSEFIEFINTKSNYIKNGDYIVITSIGDFQYKKFLKELGLNYNDYYNKGILVNKSKITYNDRNTGKLTNEYINEFDYKNKDIIETYIESKDESEEISENDVFNIEIGYVTDKKPFAHSYSQGSILIVSDKFFDEIGYKFPHKMIFYKSNNPNKLQDDIESFLGDERFYINNIEENAKIMENFYTLIAIFLYGFIIVISLIGITNIFNTITTNMELRRQEFAMLKSIGMTKHEFRKMISLESIFMGFKSLTYGIFIGIIIAYVVYLFLIKDMGLGFTPPIIGILLSIIVVYLLINLLMKYSMNKINKQNTIETIRNENI